MIEIIVKNVVSHKVDDVVAALVQDCGVDAILLKDDDENGFVLLSKDGIIEYKRIGAAYNGKTLEELCYNWDLILVKVFTDVSDFSLSFTAE